jgi:hypothetical protein
MEGEMRDNTRKSRTLIEAKFQQNSDKYLDEYNTIKDKLTFVEKEEVFPLLVKLMRICRKLQITMPSEYIQYYLQTKDQLTIELKILEKRILISQINNENYSKLEEKITTISRQLGILV